MVVFEKLSVVFTSDKTGGSTRLRTRTLDESRGGRSETPVNRSATGKIGEENRVIEMCRRIEQNRPTELGATLAY